MDEPNATKMKGLILWLDLFTGNTVDKGSADRVILRTDSLAMDITGSLGIYSVDLKRVGHLTFEGFWTLRSARNLENGSATCTLEEKDDHFQLSGEWHHGKCQWIGRLEAVDSF
jgi:hypothetical protein